MYDNLFDKATRKLTSKERADVLDLYGHGKMLANHMARVVPDCSCREDAIKALMDSLAQCERAITLHTQVEEPQINMGFTDGPGLNTREVTELIQAQAAARINEVCKEAQHKIQNLPAYARH